MSFCPKCKYEYKEGIVKCPDCDEILVPELHEGYITENDLRLVYRCDFLYKAQMVQANLNSAGIEAFILTQKDSSFPTVGDLGIINVFVRKDDAEAAMNYVKNTAMNFQEDESDEDEEEKE